MPVSTRTSSTGTPASWKAMVEASEQAPGEKYSFISALLGSSMSLSKYGSCHCSDLQDWIVRVALGAGRIEGGRIRLGQLGTVVETFHQVRVGDEGDAV